MSDRHNYTISIYRQHNLGTPLFTTKDLGKNSALRLLELFDAKFPKVDGYELRISIVSPRNVWQGSRDSLMESDNAQT